MNYISLNPRYSVGVQGNNNFVIVQRKHGNVFKVLLKIEGPKRALLRGLDKLGIVVKPDAQLKLDALPERAAFDGPEKENG